ncbi:MAG: putative ABC transporter permease [Oscillospiraceae bacterium]|nr:putative ABC transporter permease [Oscillospiraceae bacterium]
MQNIYINILNDTLFELFYYFCWWSVFGWFLEVVVRTLETGGFENRGFLNGPFCPIYGFGVTIITHILEPIQDNFFILYISSSLICTSFELLVGILMQKIFHTKWWDYSHEKFNYKGFICLRIALLWGVGSVLVIRVVHPVILKAIHYIPHTAGNVIAAFIVFFILIDLGATLADVRNFNRRLKQVDTIGKILHDKSIALGENISDEVLSLNSKYERLSEQIRNSRIVKAFPTMKPSKYYSTFEKIKKTISYRSEKELIDEKYENLNLPIQIQKDNKNENSKISNKSSIH